MKIDYIKRNCPICGSKSSKEEIYSKSRAEKTEFSLLKEIWNGFFKEKIIFTYSRCNKCKTLYCPTFFSNKHLEELYGQMPANMDQVPLSALKKNSKRIF